MIRSYSVVFVVSLSILLGDLAQAQVTPSCNDKLLLVLSHFEKLSQIYRRSGDEEAVAQFIIDLAKSHGEKAVKDAVGNVIIELPATGEFVNQALAPIGLQSHIDMVLAVRDAKPGVDIRPNFARGVPGLETTDGWLHAKDHATTLGADNGIGVAMMLRYLTDKTIAHPPLTLFFTVEEETTGRGAAGLEIPPTVKQLINLDGEDFGYIWNGGLGASTIHAEFPTLPVVSVPKGYHALNVSLSGLKGGHSGLEIHLGRANGALLSAQFIYRLMLKIPETHLLKVVAGEKGVYNKIPSFFEVAFAIPASRHSDFDAFLADYRRSLADRFEDTDGLSYRLDQGMIEEVEENTLTGIDPSSVEFARLVTYLERLPNGVLTKSTAKGFTNGMDLSSNFSFFYVEKDAAGTGLRAEFGLMPRAFVNASIDRFVQSQSAYIQLLPLTKVLTVPKTSSAWTPNDQSPLIQLFNQVAVAEGFAPFAVQSAAGGLEPSYFVEKRPDLDAISFGPNITGAHTPDEKLEISSLEKTIRLLDAFLVALGRPARVRE